MQKLERRDFIPADNQRLPELPSEWAVYGNGVLVKYFASEYNARSFARKVLGRFGTVIVSEVYR